MSEHEPRFWSRVAKGPGCWEWAGGRYTDGYGAFRVNGQNTGAHRYSWELHFGPIPEGMLVCHHCDNPPCVNPDHLFVGTQLDNQRDKWAKGRGVPGGLRGPTNPQTTLTEEQARAIKVRRAAGEKGRALAREYGISEQDICDIYKGRRWAHLEPVS